jgi:O-antigen/teichoic acid export membrane protein
VPENTNVSTSNPKRIADNTLWYAVDASVATLVMLIASVPVARVMGPNILGHYVYLMFLTSTAQRVANLGIPATCCKYMAESFGRQEYGVAHELFRVTLRYQAAISGIVTALGLCLTVFSEPGYRWIAVLIVLSMWPSMISYIPGQANVAAENLRANLPASITYLMTYCTLVVLSLTLDWGLIGLASATLVSRLLQAAVLYFGVRRWLRSYPTTPLPLPLRNRMLDFSRHNLILLALGLIVWDRSEVLFLKQFSDVRQVAFYSLAFSITNQLLMAPRALSTAIGITILAQYGRDPRQLGTLMRNAVRYVSVVAIPLFLGMAAIAEPLIRSSYGNGYLLVVPVLAILCIASIPRAFQPHTENLLQATEQQAFMVKWMVITAAANLSLDALLIPKHGALGAGIANGLAQIIGVAGLFHKAGGTYAMRSQIRFLGALSLSGAVMVCGVLVVVRALPSWSGLLAGIGAGAAVFFLCLRTTRSLEAEDWDRLHQWTMLLPKPLHRIALPLLTLWRGPKYIQDPAAASGNSNH